MTEAVKISPDVKLVASEMKKADARDMDEAHPVKDLAPDPSAAVEIGGPPAKTKAKTKAKAKGKAKDKKKAFADGEIIGLGALAGGIAWWLWKNKSASDLQDAGVTHAQRQDECSAREAASALTAPKPDLDDSEPKMLTSHTLAYPYAPGYSPPPVAPNYW